MAYNMDGIMIGAGPFKTGMAGPRVLSGGADLLMDSSQTWLIAESGMRGLTFHNPSANPVYIGGPDVDETVLKYHRKLSPDESWALNITEEGAGNLYVKGTAADNLVVGLWA